MKSFEYKAKELKTGKVVKGVLTADNERMAGKVLVEQGYVPDSIKIAGEENVVANFLGRITTKDKVLFSRQFATLIGAGLPLSDSLRTMVDQTSNKKMRNVIEDILVQVSAGKSLAVAFARHPDVFDKVYLALIEAGEMSGTLDESLKRLATQQEKDAAMMSKIRSAMTYPAIVLLVINGVMIFMMMVVVPQVESLYKDLKQELPALTAGMAVFARFLMSFWWLILGLVGFLGWFLVTFFKTEVGVRWGCLIKLNIPMFNSLFRRLYMARFTRTAQILLATGVPILDVLRISGEAMNNAVVNEQIKEATDKVKSGKKLSESLEDREYILPLVPQMASIGEQSGKMDEMLGKVAQVYEDELDEQIKAISTMIEPVLMIVLAVMAGGMVAAILLPIYSLVNNIA